MIIIQYNIYLIWQKDGSNGVDKVGKHQKQRVKNSLY